MRKQPKKIGLASVGAGRAGLVRGEVAGRDAIGAACAGGGKLRQRTGSDLPLPKWQGGTPK